MQKKSLTLINTLVQICIKREIKIKYNKETLEKKKEILARTICITKFFTFISSFYFSNCFNHAYQMGRSVLQSSTTPDQGPLSKYPCFSCPKKITLVDQY